MTLVTGLYRHPIKSHGREALDAVMLTAGQAMPYDRTWAVAHSASRATGDTWVPCVNFSRVSKAPKLMAITSTLDEETRTLRLAHPERPELVFHPDNEAERFIEWVMPLVPKDRSLPERIVKLPKRGFTDSEFASVTLCNLASHRDVESQIGRELSIHRWRGNIWFDCETPWCEFDWMDKTVRIGSAVLRVRERTDRCRATTVNPDTGAFDADTLAALRSLGHQDFSVRAEVIQSGEVSVGDQVEVC